MNDSCIPPTVAIHFKSFVFHLIMKKTGKKRDRLPAVKRAQAIVVILALLAVPAMLLADVWTDCSHECSRMCCLRHRQPAAPTQPEDIKRASDEEPTCHHRAAGHMMQCQMKMNHSGVFSSSVAPIPPTLLSASARVAAPGVQSEILSRYLRTVLPGFSSPPFEPPRI